MVKPTFSSSPSPSPFTSPLEPDKSIFSLLPTRIRYARITCGYERRRKKARWTSQFPKRGDKPVRRTPRGEDRRRSHAPLCVFSSGAGYIGQEEEEVRSELEDLFSLPFFFFEPLRGKKGTKRRRRREKRTSFRAFLRGSLSKGKRLADGGKINGKPREPFQTEQFRCPISGTALTIES